MGGALLSAVANRTLISLSALFVLVGFLVGDGGLGLVHVSPESAMVEMVAVLALLVVLFSDGLEVDHDLVRSNWHLPLRKLVVGMPITAAVIAVAAHFIVGLDWIQALLLGALLAPTDPVLSSGVITNTGIPARIRHSLHLESGLNDGLALPAVLTFTAIATVSPHDDVVWWSFLLQDVVLGLILGLIVGYVAARVLPSSAIVQERFPAHTKSMYALGVPLLTYGLVTVLPAGNGLVAVFVCAIMLAKLRPDVAHRFEQAQDIVEIIKVVAFVVFGTLISVDLLSRFGWEGALLVACALLVARPIAVFASLARTGLRTDEKVFMAWFGPKGIATVAFALLVLHKHVPQGEEIFRLAALVVFCSALLHGITDTPGARWMARRSVGREA